MNLEKADLRGASLEGAVLDGARLAGASLRLSPPLAFIGGSIPFLAMLILTILTHPTLFQGFLYVTVLMLISQPLLQLGCTDLTGADLTGADLRGADLSSALLRKAKLRRADLRGADLRSANLAGADLRAADLVGADLTGAVMGMSVADARYDETTRWPEGFDPQAQGAIRVAELPDSP